MIDPMLGKGEVKRRKDGFKQLYTWLEGKDYLALRADRRKWLVVVELDKLLTLLNGSDRNDSPE